MKLEIEPVSCKGNVGFWSHALISTVTGYSIQEISSYHKEGDRVKSRTFKEVIRKLGYNCSERFKKFEIDVQNPCLLRCNDSKDKSHWYVFAFYDGFVYDSNARMYSLKTFGLVYPDLKISSMIEVSI